MTHPPATDVHTHLAARLPDGDRHAFGVGIASGRYVIDGQPVGPDALYDPDALVAHLREQGLDRAVVSVPPPLFRQGLAQPECERWAVALNDGLLAAVGDRDALYPLAYLPLDQPEAARGEYEWRRTQHSWAGYVASAGGGSVPLDDPALEPLWAAMHADGALLMLHPGSSPDTRLRRHYLANLLGNPVETTVSAAELVFGGVLYRYPDVSFLLVHCGGAVPALAGRWQRGLATNRPGVADLALPPADAVRRFWVDALAHDPAVVDLALQVLGEDKIVLGSDWPFPMGAPAVRATVAHLPADLRERIERDNPGTLLGLSLPA